MKAAVVFFVSVLFIATGAFSQQCENFTNCKECGGGESCSWCTVGLRQIGEGGSFAVPLGVCTSDSCDSVNFGGIRAALNLTGGIFEIQAANTSDINVCNDEEIDPTFARNDCHSCFDTDSSTIGGWCTVDLKAPKLNFETSAGLCLPKEVHFDGQTFDSSLLCGLVKSFASMAAPNFKLETEFASTAEECGGSPSTTSTTTPTTASTTTPTTTPTTTSTTTSTTASATTTKKRLTSTSTTSSPSTTSTSSTVSTSRTTTSAAVGPKASVMPIAVLVVAAMTF